MSSPSLTFPSLILTILFLLFLIPHSHSRPPPPPNPAAPVPVSSVCQNTLYPGYCRNVLQSDNTTTTTTAATVYDYGRFYFKKSISEANKFLHLIEKYLSRSSKHDLIITPAAIAALQDCQLMAQLNLDFLTSSYSAVQSTSKTLPTMKSDDVTTLLSGVLTNQQTCLDGLTSASSAWSIDHGLTTPLSNDSKLYSVSLALFTRAWAPVKKPSSQSGLGRTHSAFHHGHLQRLMYSAQARLQSRRLVENASNDDGDGNDEVMIDDIVTVNQDGTGNFTTINDAVLAAPDKSDGSDGYFLIYVSAGVYEENVVVSKKKRYIMMIGDGINQTIITGNRSVMDNYTTFNSATFAVVGTGFVGVNITIRNTAGAIMHQAVALRNGADLSTFYTCSFEGYQDTLYAHSLRQFYRECDIYGTVDFIFGNAAVVLQNCNLYPRLPMNNQFNAITAQGRTDPFQNTGISIENCTVRAADDLANSDGTTRTYLGRPWKQYSRTVYMNSYIDSVVDPVGWTDWNGTAFALDTLYYGEYDNRGTGSDTSKRVSWPGYHVMNSTDALNFTVSNFIFGDDWLPQTGVSYDSGLIY